MTYAPSFRVDCYLLLALKVCLQGFPTTKFSSVNPKSFLFSDIFLSVKICPGQFQVLQLKWYLIKTRMFQLRQELQFNGWLALIELFFYQSIVGFSYHPEIFHSINAIRPNVINEINKLSMMKKKKLETKE